MKVKPKIKKPLSFGIRTVYSSHWIFLFRFYGFILDDQGQVGLETHVSHPSGLSPLFLYGFFEIRHRVKDSIITVNCMTCQRMGRQNLLHTHEEKTSNLVAHLKVRSQNMNTEFRNGYNLMA